jgi:futalosine hydrolase
LDRLVLICSVALEAEPLLAVADAVEPLGIPRLEGWSARIGSSDIYLLTGGMAKTNAARALTAVVEHRAVSGVLGFGVAGAYLGSGLIVGDVALATSEHYGDEGVETPAGWLSCEGIGIPLVANGAAPLFNDFPLNAERVAAASEVLAAGGIRSKRGPFVTVSTCSGTASRGRGLEQRFAAICETMEGAAYAHVAALYDLPFLEVRGISNMVEDRNFAGWKLREAAAAAAEALPILIERWPTLQ